MPIIKFNGTEYSSGGEAHSLHGAVVRGEASSAGGALIYLAATAQIEQNYTDNNGVFLITEGYGDIPNQVQGILNVNVRQRAQGNIISRISWEYVSSAVKLNDYFVGYKIDPDTNLITVNLYMVIRQQYDSRIITLLTEGALNGTYNDNTKWTLFQGGSTIGTTRPAGFTYVNSTLNTLANPASTERVYCLNTTNTTPMWFKIGEIALKRAWATSTILFRIKLEGSYSFLGILELKCSIGSSISDIAWRNIEWAYKAFSENGAPYADRTNYILKTYSDGVYCHFELWIKNPYKNMSIIVEKIGEYNEGSIGHDHEYLEQKWEWRNPLYTTTTDPFAEGDIIKYSSDDAFVMRTPAKSLWLPEVNKNTSTVYADLNNYTENGRYYVKWLQEGPPANMPWGCTDGWLEVQANASGNVLQVFYRCGTKDVNDTEVFRREKFATSVGWTEWRRFSMASTVRKNVDLNEFRVEGSWYIEDAASTSAAHHLPSGAISGWLDVKVRNQTIDNYNAVTQIFYRMDLNYYDFLSTASAISTYRRSAFKNNDGSYKWTPWSEFINTGTQLGRAIVNENRSFPKPSVPTGVWIRIAKLTNDSGNAWEDAKGASGLMSTITIEFYYNKYPNECYQFVFMSKWSQSSRLYQTAGRCSSTQHMSKIRYISSETDKCGYLDVYWVAAESNTVQISIVNAEASGTYWILTPQPLQETPETKTGETVEDVKNVHSDFIPGYQLHDYRDDRRISMGYSYPAIQNNQYSWLAAWYDTGENAGVQLRSVDPSLLYQKIKYVRAINAYGGWNLGMELNRVPISWETPMTSGSYHPHIGFKGANGNVFNIGGYSDNNGDEFRINAYFGSRAVNGYDLTFYMRMPKNSSNYKEILFGDPQGINLPTTQVRFEYCNIYLSTAKSIIWKIPIANKDYPEIKNSNEHLTFNAKSGHIYMYVSSDSVGGLSVLSANGQTYKPVLASAFTVSSSKKIKTNAISMSKELAKTLLQYNVLSYDYIDGETNCYGMFAEDIKEYYPYAVIETVNSKEIEDENGNKETIQEESVGLDYSRFVPQMIKMIQLQEDDIVSLKNEVESLKYENQLLHSRLDAIEEILSNKF